MEYGGLRMESERWNMEDRGLRVKLEDEEWISVLNEGWG